VDRRHASPACARALRATSCATASTSAVFAPPATLEPRVDAPLRVLVEGNANVWFKGVNEAVAAVSQMNEPHELTVVAPNREGLVVNGAARVVGPLTQRDLAALYADSDVLVKLSRVEGMYGPPLEAFHMGATCVTTEVTGHEEYVEHGVNALVCDWDDPRARPASWTSWPATACSCTGCASGALDTARAWPTGSRPASSWPVRAAGHPPRRPARSEGRAAGLMADVRAGMEEQRYLVRDQETRLIASSGATRRCPESATCSPRGAGARPEAS
jgi:hypothetical protein